MTPLMEAAWSGRDKMVEELLKAGARPNVKNNYGETALCYAQRAFVRHQKKVVNTLKMRVRSVSSVPPAWRRSSEIIKKVKWRLNFLSV